LPTETLNAYTQPPDDIHPRNRARTPIPRSDVESFPVFSLPGIPEGSTLAPPLSFLQRGTPFFKQSCQELQQQLQDILARLDTLENVANNINRICIEIRANTPKSLRTPKAYVLEQVNSYIHNATSLIPDSI
jgi:hypothetical protein